MSDVRDRRRITEELGRTMVVEAAAGTGKTTALVERIVSVLGAGARVEAIAAVTFTEKAAGELKLRLRSALEQARNTPDPSRGRHLEEALAHLEEAAIGTIHSFCADLLAEYPVEAGVDPAFTTLAEGAAEQLFAEVFEDWFRGVLAAPPPGVRRFLRRTHRDGVRKGLYEAARDLLEWRDLRCPWRQPVFDRRARIDELLERLRAFAGRLRACPTGNDPFYRDTSAALHLVERLEREESASSRDDDALEGQLVELLSGSAWRYGFRKPRKGRGREFAPGIPRQEIHQEHARLLADLEGFRRDADAELAALLQRELLAVVDAYEERKKRTGAVDYLDLLLRTRDLLRQHRKVRVALQERFRHLFVDEVQDTDPLQAEILMLLAADDPDQTDWRRVRPVPGKLFLVGDPRQSIYRFRRADVRTYQELKRRLIAQGAVLVRLRTSYRAVPTLQNLVNTCFREEMEAGPDLEYVPLEPHRSDFEDRPAVVVLPVPEPYNPSGNVVKQKVEESLPDAVGAFVHWLLQDSGWSLQARDVCLLFRRLVSWGRDLTRPYREALEARGIPHLLVGGRDFHGREEVEMLRVACQAVEWPGDELSVFATLRGPLFALRDETLLEYRLRGYPLDPLEIPADLPPTLRPVGEILEFLGRLHRERNRRPVAETLWELLKATRIHVHLVLRPSGEQALANVLALVEEARTWEARGGRSFRSFVEEFRRQAEEGEAEEPPILEEGSEGVRMMTVHRAKGLEFPAVILVDPCANLAPSSPARHLDISRGRCALRLAGLTPLDLAEHEAEELQAERAEGVRLTYVAATRARDLLVVPGILDGPPPALKDSWLSPLHRGIYPPDLRAPAQPAPGCPPFHRRGCGGTPGVGIQPGLHRVNGVPLVWWGLDSLPLGVTRTSGFRCRQLLSKEVPREVVEEDRRRLEEWRAARERDRRSGSVPEFRLVRATDPEAGAEPGSGKGALTALGEEDGWGETVEVVRLAAERHAFGVRYGRLVHRVLARLPLDAGPREVARMVDLQARLSAATEEERRAARETVARILAHPLFAAARGATQVRREVPVTLRREEGVLISGVADLAFETGGSWTVVEFKTGEERLDDYRRQAGVYARAIAAATGAPARAVVFLV